MDPCLLDRRTFDAAALVREHPPRFEDPRKRLFAGLVLGPADRPAGTMELTRWDAGAVPELRPARRPRLVERPGFYRYEPAPGAEQAGALAWHLNFATDDCFAFYAGPLLAQDELQVLEHPALASLREASLAQGFPLLCRDGDDPTPVLVAGVERRGFLDTRPAPGRPDGLYGHAFAAASPAQVRGAAARLDPPTRTNLLALEAPICGEGRYAAEEIAEILRTAHAGFRAAVLATRARLGPAARTVLHTGFWGCGAYGGDRVLMALLQLLAAELAGLDELHFHAAGDSGAGDLARARDRYEALPAGAGVAALVAAIAALGFTWGEGDGT